MAVSGNEMAPKRRKIRGTFLPSQSGESSDGQSNGRLATLLGDIDGNDGSDDEDQSQQGDVDADEDVEEEEATGGDDAGWVMDEILPLPSRMIRGEERIYQEPLPKFNGSKAQGPNMKIIRDGKCHRPVDYVFLFFSTVILDTFLSATNAYGFNFIKDWTLLGLAEFKAFLSIILVLGLYKFPSRKCAFEKTIYGCQFANRLMNLGRFNNILRAWHYEDYTKYSEDNLKQAKKNDPFFPVKAFLVLLAQSFERAFNPGQFMDIDEQSIPWKGRHIARCYNPSKPEKWHFKVYSLNDAQTGYMMSFYLYQGKSESRPVDIPASEYPFHQLIGTKGKYQNKNHIIVTDNWYTSIGSIKFCLGSGNHSIGTVKTNKKGLCKATIFPKTGRGKQPRGAAIQMAKEIIPNQKVYQLSWQDNKPVHLLSTLPSYEGQVLRNSINKNGTFEKINIYRPSIVDHYNFGMGGTDNQDQNMSYYRPRIKTVSWTTRVLVHFFCASVFNAFVLYRLANDCETDYKYKDFIRDVAEQLSEDWMEIKHSDNANQREHVDGFKTRKGWSKDHIRRLSGTHTPVSSMVEQREIKNNKISIRTNSRGNCMICNTKVVVQCQECHVYLCVAKRVNCLSCWEQFHTCRDLMGCTFSAPAQT